MITAEEQEQHDSYAKEQQFEKRVAFATYGEGVLLLMRDIMTLTEEDFFEKYKTFKRIVNAKIAELETAVKERDYLKRNELYDYFIEVL